MPTRQKRPQTSAVHCDFPKRLRAISEIICTESYPSVVRGKHGLECKSLARQQLAWLGAIPSGQIQVVALGVHELLAIPGPSGAAHAQFIDSLRRTGGYGNDPQRASRVSQDASLSAIRAHQEH